MAHAKVGVLTPPSAPPGRRIWKTYEPVPVADVDLMMARLTAPASWPDFGSDHGRFTPLRPGGLLGQTFEIEVVAGAGTRHPLLTRGYVTCTRLENGDRPQGLESLVAEMDAGLAGVGARTLPDGHHAVAVAQLTTHAGHFMGPGLSHLVVSAGPGGAALRDVGSWDPMRFPMSLAYRLGGWRRSAPSGGSAARRTACCTSSPPPDAQPATGRARARPSRGISSEAARQEADGPEEGRRVGRVGVQDLAGLGEDERRDRRDAEEDRPDHVEHRDPPGRVAAPPAPRPPAQGHDRDVARHQEADRPDRVGRPDAMDPLLGVEGVVQAGEGGPVEEEGPGELDRRGQAVEPSATHDGLRQLERRRRR